MPDSSVLVRARVARVTALAVVASCAATVSSSAQQPLAEQAEIRRTPFGVPHILAENLRAAAFALGYVQMEDYGGRVVRGLIRARGEMARTFGPDSIGTDFHFRQSLARARETYHWLDSDTREVYEGFATGVNHFVSLHPDAFDHYVPRFTGHDVAARGIVRNRANRITRFLDALEARTDSMATPQDRGGRAAGSRFTRTAPAGDRARRAGVAAFGHAAAANPTPAPSDTRDLWRAMAALEEAEEGRAHPDVGSNAWALAPDRTTTGNAILLRNPHLSWDAGYYEAHVTVPGVLNFYGDFRIGGPFGIIGGFNERLGWATTNNNPDLEEIYALEPDPHRTNHYLFDGGSIPLEREEITVEFKNGEGFGTQTRDLWRTPLGAVIHQEGGRIFVIRAAREGEYRVGQQFLRMMRAGDLAEWKEAMAAQARTSSNLTYADADGNIFYVWNAATPVIPHPPTGDTLATDVGRSDEVWTRIVPFAELPQFLNPPGGYLHNENDPFHFTNLGGVMDPADFPPNFPEPRLGLRSQHGLALVSGDDRLSLEEVVRRKHSMGMLLADRLKDDLIEALRAARSDADVQEAADILASWDNTVARESRGGVLFAAWAQSYLTDVDTDSLFAVPWSVDEPTATPRGLGSPVAALEIFERTLTELEELGISPAAAWGDVHRVRRGDVDVPVGGCGGSLGCFRVLSFEEDEDGKRRAVRGDGWVLAVEFSEPAPRAYSVLAYGQSDREDSPHFDDQAAMFADNRMKPVAFTEDDIAAGLVRSYRPGEEAR
jgi:acyl-homoserine-lactone acylase